ncbi:Uncharacterised protein [Mycobacteroides abscessus subsp. abscessus]|nr:Uncharacterised protein [Mycobacteroides abscessus subsp. abscessus]
MFGPRTAPELLHQHCIAAVNSTENAAVGDRWQRLPGRGQQTARSLVECPGNAGSCRAQTRRRGRARIHATEQRIDQPGDDLRPESQGDKVGDGRFGSDGPMHVALGFTVDAGNGFLVDEPHHRRRRSRNAVHCSRGQRMQAAAGVDQRPRAGGVERAVGQPQFIQQVENLRAPGDEGLGADVDPVFTQGDGAQDAAQLPGRVVEADAGVITKFAAEPICRRQARNTAPHNGNGGRTRRLRRHLASSHITTSAPAPPHRSVPPDRYPAARHAPD